MKKVRFSDFHEHGTWTLIRSVTSLLVRSSSGTLFEGLLVTGRVAGGLRQALSRAVFEFFPPRKIGNLDFSLFSRVRISDVT